MAKTGPQKYPPASLSYWWQNAFPGNAMESNVGVLHTTEGRTVPDYRGGRDAPNFTALPDIPNRKLRWYQHFDFDTSSRALVNAAGGVETNTANAVQVELVGTCDERNSVTWDGKRAGVDYIFWPDAPDWLLAELALFVRWAHEQHGVKLSSTVTWKAYKKGQTGGSYGANGVRLTGAQWGAYYGWLGHQHVPENDHGDPGNLNFARVLDYARGKTPDPSEEDDMPTAQEIAAAVWEHQLPNVRSDGSQDGTKKSAYWWLVWQDVTHAQLMKAIADSKMTPEKFAQAVADGVLKVKVTVEPATPKAV
jgi:hypothetical protein